jgi:PAS domain S-box-containing protein
MTNKNSDYYFLRGGGDMGKLIREKDWSKTSLGDPSGWPQSLCTMVAVMLDNPFGMYIAWGSEYTQLYNDGYRPILGATKHPQALGISTRETFSEIWHIIESMFDGVMKGKAIGFPDFMLPLNRNGFIEECYFDFSYSPIRKNDGEVGGVLVTVIETTHKKKAEDKLKESNQRFRDTMKQAPVGITILRGPQYIVEMANDAYLQLVDRKESEFVGNPLFDSLPEVEETVHSLLDDVLNTGVPFHGHEVPIPVNRYGKEGLFYFDFMYHPLREEDGKISGIIVAVTEVTKNVEVRKKVEESEERFRSLAQTLPQLTWVTDEKGNAEFTSSRWKDFTGVEPTSEEIWRSIVHPEDYASINEAWHNSLTTGSDYKYDVRIKSKDGQYRWHRVIGEPVLDNNNKIVKWVGAFTDVQNEKTFTNELEKKVAERTLALEDSNIELGKMNKELESFAYISSHDLQEPLRKIQTFSSQLREKEYLNLTEKGKEKFSRMQNAAERMQTLINDLLVYSRTNSVDRKFEITDLNRIIGEIKEDMKEELQQKHASLVTDELCQAYIIPFQFRQLLINLINNSLKFAKPQEPPCIEIKSRVTSGAILNNEKLAKNSTYCHISVTDNGIGFEEQYNEKVFEVFQRLHDKNEFQGTGIGLAIVKRIVENHKGIVTAKGELNKGVRFDIYIPAADH